MIRILYEFMELLLEIYDELKLPCPFLEILNVSEKLP